TPPFDITEHDPGYIKGYVPGIRENGGQYTHAALWAIWATAQLGDGDRAEALLRMLNPIYHADTSDKIEQYRVEPYVIAADVYSMPPHVGRGGWTWYTGSAGWMYRLALEMLLGVQRHGEYLSIHPRLPSHWTGFKLRYRYGNIIHEIKVTQSSHPGGEGDIQVLLNGQPVDRNRIPLRGDRDDA
ncbi:MAG TPA: glycosyl hydrolase family 65 protein, partial [Phototrophicaceae bacterium]|nr:glycosyl hydrolase family 65 protein [Phototrophicaceae bacterium]